MFKYYSEPFITNKEMESEKKLLIKNLCEHFGLERKSFRLQLGTITLQGLTKEDNWINITSRIGSFKEYISNKGYESFRLKSILEIKK